MKKALFIAAALVITFCAAESFAGGRYGGYNGYGYSAPKSYSYGGSGSRSGYSNYSFSPAPQRNYSHGGEIYMQNGYSRQNGTYVMPHFKTQPDNYRWNNLSEWGR